MSSLFEKAIADAKELKETALKNAEQLIIEKYSTELKEAVENLLEEEDEELDMEMSVEEPEAPTGDDKLMDQVPDAATALLSGEMDDDEEIELAFANNSGLAKKGDVTLVMRLIEGEFPNYNQVIPNDLTRHLILPTDSLVQAVRRVALLSSERSRAVKLELGDGQLVITSNNPDLGDAREELDVDYAGDPLTIGFNARYLLDAINAVQLKEIRFSFQDELSPSRVTPPDDEKTLAVVMPMRI